MAHKRTDYWWGTCIFSTVSNNIKNAEVIIWWSGLKWFVIVDATIETYVKMRTIIFNAQFILF